MISMWTLYLLNMLFNLFNLSIILFIFSGAALILYNISKFVDGDVEEFFKPYIRWISYACIISLSILILVPTKKEALAIYMIPKIVNNESVQQMPDTALKSMKYLNLMFEKELKELKDKE